ncbi:Oxysterol binding protein [Kappamyces sp. JEL0680]|nr:Oxysterol binding protein [Kappamyces sp. JEL0680]
MANTADYSGEFMKFLSQLASATGDLSNMTCPAFLLNGYSLLEYSQHWGDHPDLLYDISNPKYTDENERMLACTRWFLSTLYGSFRSRCENTSEKKPFNPVLGELFKATWNDENSTGWGEASLVVEQGGRSILLMRSVSPSPR